MKCSNKSPAVAMTKKCMFMVALCVLVALELRFFSAASTGVFISTLKEEELLSTSQSMLMPPHSALDHTGRRRRDGRGAHLDDDSNDDDEKRIRLRVRIPGHTNSTTKSSKSSSSALPSFHKIASKQNPLGEANSVKPKPPFQNGIRRYAQSPLIKGYKPTGGLLPHDAAEYLVDPKMWRYVDNRTCLADSNSTVAAWQRRAPYAILLGTMKGGTHALTSSLWEHPLVAKTNHWEMHFFNNGNLAIRTEKGIQQQTSRQNYAKAFLKAIPGFPTEDSSNVIGIDSSPRYILSSDRIPDLMFCVAPWAKLLAILRDPVERASSQYRYLDETRRRYDKPMVDWETWIQDDIRLLNQAGVLKAQTPEEEGLAWKKYQRRPNSNQIVGRGLYVIQLEQYFEAMDRSGKSRSDLLVLQSEQFRQNRQREYDKVLEFLSLPAHRLVNFTEEHTTNKYLTTPMPDISREKLKELYRPYNERLYKLLGWGKVWD